MDKPVDIEELRKLLDKATPGEWFAYSLLASGIHAGYRYGIANSEPCGIIQDEDGVVYPDFPDWNNNSRIVVKTTDSDTARGDAIAIAALHNASPALLAELEALRAVRDAAKKVRKRWRFDNNQQHTHSWHDMEDVCGEIDRALAKCPGGDE